MAIYRRSAGADEVLPLVTVAWTTSRVPERERFVRFLGRRYRWRPATAARPEGLAPAVGSRGPRFDAACLDGDALQAQV